MKQIRLNTLIVIDYESDKIDKVTDIEWVNGIDEILKEELSFEFDGVDNNAKITIETVIQKMKETNHERETNHN